MWDRSGVAAAAGCTAYRRDDIGRALLPALVYIRNTDELGTLIAVAGDLAAQRMENTPEAFSRNGLALTRLMQSGR